MYIPTPDEITKHIQRIHDPVYFGRILDYFRTQRIDQSLVPGGGVGWYILQPTQQKIYNSGNNYCGFWAIMSNTLPDFAPDFHARIGGKYMVYDSRVWSLFERELITYFTPTNKAHFTENFPIFMGEFLVKHHEQILQILYQRHEKDVAEAEPEKVNWFQSFFSKLFKSK